jgi:type I restriction enzyme S subunit
MERKLPKGWKWLHLDDVAEIYDESRKPVKAKDRVPGHIPYCGANGVIDSINGFTHDGDFVLLAEDGGFYGAGELSAYRMLGKFWANNHVHILRGIDNVIDNVWLMYALRVADLRSYLSGTTRPKLTQGAMRSILLPVPDSIETQRHIVAILDMAEETRRLRAQADELASRLPMNIFLDMFGDPKHNIKGWEMVTPPDIASADRNAIAIGPFGSDLMAKDYRENGVPLVFVKNIRDNRFDGRDIRYVDYSKAEELKAHLVNPGDILMTKMGDPPGDVAVYPENIMPGIITADCIKFTVNERLAANIYVLNALNTDFVQNQVIKNTKGAAQQKINLNIFKSIKFPLPPIELQKKFSKIVNQSEKIRALQRKSYSETEFLFTTLMQKAFTGETI